MCTQVSKQVQTISIWGEIITLFQARITALFKHQSFCEAIIYFYYFYLFHFWNLLNVLFSWNKKKDLPCITHNLNVHMWYTWCWQAFTKSSRGRLLEEKWSILTETSCLACWSKWSHRCSHVGQDVVDVKAAAYVSHQCGTTRANTRPVSTCPSGAVAAFCCFCFWTYSVL